MKLVVGLGNPGRKYTGTRHNIGFDVLDELARRNAAPAPRSMMDAQVSDVVIGDQRVLLAAPQTYMNLSGRAVRQIVDFYKLPLDDVLIVCDDLNLPCGKLRLRRSGSAGGQKGLQNIIEQLGTEEFARLRIGIDRPTPPMEPTAYVLARFSPQEREAISTAVLDAAEGVEVWLRAGADAAMNRINSGKPDPD
jgi:PTH1 family peptidyl-tRNA hydrolase